MDVHERIVGCLLGGAVGDALGEPIEFSSLDAIRRRWTRDGVVAGRHISDDTQMTLFTAEGLLRASVRQAQKGVCDPRAMIHRAYLRWLHTQGEAVDVPLDGWLVDRQVLHQRRAPGTTCLGALRSGVMGTAELRRNDSKGCGGVMRVAPAGCLSRSVEVAYALGRDAAAITHGHPSGFVAAGAFAAMIHAIVAGADVRGAVDIARDVLDRDPDAQETADALDGALVAGKGGPPSGEDLERLGGGWTAEEALAIAVACAVAAPDFESGVVASVTHSGDSDSTGAICGNLLGAALGAHAIPAAWVEVLDAFEVVQQVAEDLYRARSESPASDEWWRRYPGE